MIHTEHWFRADRSSEIALADREMRENPSLDNAYRLWTAWSRVHGVPTGREYERAKWDSAPGVSLYPISFTTLPNLFLYAIEETAPTDIPALSLWSRNSRELPDVPFSSLLSVAHKEWEGFSWWKSIAVRHGNQTLSSFIDSDGVTRDYSRDVYGRLSAPGPENHKLQYGLLGFLNDLRGRSQRENTFGWTREEPQSIGAYWHILRDHRSSEIPPEGARAYSNIGSDETPVYSTYWTLDKRARAIRILDRVAKL